MRTFQRNSAFKIGTDQGHASAPLESQLFQLPFLIPNRALCRSKMLLFYPCWGWQCSKFCIKKMLRAITSTFFFLDAHKNISISELRMFSVFFRMSLKLCYSTGNFPANSPWPAINKARRLCSHPPPSRCPSPTPASMG